MEKVINYLQNKITKNDYVVVAVSGGPDSMALLSILSFVSSKVICAHVNHNVRSESVDEAKMVEQYCQEKGFIFESMIIENYSEDNFHQEARNIRYKFFEEILDKYNSKYLLTAHHGDDLIETILMRLVRGSTLKGYSGFQKEVVKSNYTILRPLIELTKEEIIAFDKKNKVPYVNDLSNEKDVYTRNRFRKNVLPFLKEENPNVLKKFSQFSQTLLEYDKYISLKASEIKEKIYQANVLDLSLFDLDLVIQKEIIRLILEEIYQSELYLINDKHINLIIDLINSSKGNSLVYLPNKLKVIKTYNMLEFYQKEIEKIEYNFEIIDKVNLPNGKNIERVSDSKLTDNFICRLDSSEISWPLYVRTRRNGDKMEVKKLNGHKKINDIFIDSKIPLSERILWPVVTDSNGVIVWLPGLKKSKLDKTEQDKYDIILMYY